MVFSPGCGSGVLTQVRTCCSQAVDWRISLCCSYSYGYVYAASCYAQPAVLFRQGFTLLSKCGVQQGDACDLALFAIPLQRLVLKLEEVGLKLQFWFLDDGILCGRPEAVVKALDVLRTELPKIGLPLNVAKY